MKIILTFFLVFIGYGIEQYTFAGEFFYGEIVGMQNFRAPLQESSQPSIEVNRLSPNFLRSFPERKKDTSLTHLQEKRDQEEENLIESGISEEKGSQKNSTKEKESLEKLNKILLSHFKSRFKKEFEELKIQGQKKSRGDPNILLLYYENALHEIDVQIRQIYEQKNPNTTKKILLEALKSYREDIISEQKTIRKRFFRQED